MNIYERNIDYPLIKNRPNLIWEIFSKRYIILYLTLIALLVKSILFMSLTASNTALDIDILNVIYSSPPVLLYLSFICMFLSFAFLFKGKMQILYLLLLNLIFSVLFITDLWYYRGFGSFISPYLLSQTANLDNMAGSILSFVYPIDMIFISDFIILPFIIYKNSRPLKESGRKLKLFAILLALSLIYMGFTHLWLDVLGKGDGDRFFIRKDRAWNPRWSMMIMSPIGYHLYDAYKCYTDSRPYTLASSEKSEIGSWYDNKKENLPDNSYKGLLKGKNLILIQVESLEKFVINQKVNNQEITPNINRLLKNSLYFTNFYEQVNNGTSSDADLLSNTSMYPVREGSTFFRYPNNTYNSLPRLVKGMGYNTLAIHPDKGGFWNWMPALYSIGFEKCIDASFFDADEIIGLGLSDGSYLRQIEPVVKTLKQPFYTFMVTLTSHGPFDIPDSFREIVLSEDLNKTKLGGYFQSIRYTDKHIGNFISNLDRDGMLDNTVVVIYGDHTGVHKYYDDELKNISPSEDWWFEGYNQIPFIIYSKGMKGEVINTNGGQVDILPTISYLLGVDEAKYTKTALGRNLLKTQKSFAVLPNGKYIGESTAKTDAEEAVKGLLLSDKLLRSNYFKETFGYN